MRESLSALAGFQISSPLIIITSSLCSAVASRVSIASFKKKKKKGCLCLGLQRTNSLGGYCMNWCFSSQQLHHSNILNEWFLAADHESTAASWLAHTGWLSLITEPNLIRCPPTSASLLDLLMKLITRFLLHSKDPNRVCVQHKCGAAWKKKKKNFLHLR